MSNRMMIEMPAHPTAKMVEDATHVAAEIFPDARERAIAIGFFMAAWSAVTLGHCARRIAGASEEVFVRPNDIKAYEKAKGVDY